MNKKELSWLIVVSITIVALSTYPYLAGYRAQTEGLVFSGAAYDRADYAVHLASMHLGTRGEWQYRFRFTHEPHEGRFVKLGYVFLGRLAGWVGLSPEVAYQLFRILFGLLACIFIYLLMVQAFEEIHLRRLGFLLATMGAGLGWLQLMSGWNPDPNLFPIDLWLIDAFIFFGIFVFPHFGLIVAFLAGSVTCYLSYLKAPRPGKLLCVALIGAGILLIQPYTVALADLAYGGALAGHWWGKRDIAPKEFLSLLAIGLTQVPLLLYNIIVFNSSPWDVFVAQNISPSPPFVYYLLGFAAFWPLAILALRKVFAGPTAPITAAAAWALGALILAYVPLDIQRRFTMALSLPLGILAAEGFGRATHFAKSRRPIAWIYHRKNILYLLLVGFAALTPLYHYFGTALLIQARPPTLFDPANLVRATTWLGGQAGPEDCVVGAEQTGLLVAARTGRRVYLGHESETLYYADKKSLIEAFYQNDEDGKDLVFVDCEWVVYGPHEKALGPSFDAGAFSGLEKEYDTDGVAIFKKVNH